MRKSWYCACSEILYYSRVKIRLKAVLHETEFSARSRIFRYNACIFEIQPKSRLIKVQQRGGNKKRIAFYFYGEILISTNQNLFSCKQTSSFKPRVHRESTENGGSKQAGLFSGQQFQLDVESINALLRVTQASNDKNVLFHLPK